MGTDTLMDRVVAFSFLVLVLLVAAGWLMNLYKLIMTTEELTVFALVQLVGIFIVPLGGLMGWVA